MAWCLTNSKVQVSITNTEAVPHTQGPFLVIYEPSYLTYKVYNASALTVSLSLFGSRAETQRLGVTEQEGTELGW